MTGANALMLGYQDNFIYLFIFFNFRKKNKHKSNFKET